MPATSPWNWYAPVTEDTAEDSLGESSEPLPLASMYTVTPERTVSSASTEPFPFRSL